jgi:hypothetical protein
VGTLAGGYFFAACPWALYLLWEFADLMAGQLADLLQFAAA